MLVKYCLLWLLAGFLKPVILCGQQPRSYILIVGLKEINDSIYKKKYNVTYSHQAIAGADKDCDIINNIAIENNQQVTLLRDKEATKKNVLKAIETIGKKMQQDNTPALFTFYYTGHGDQIPDKSNDEESRMDQVFVCYDDYLVDDEIDPLLRKYFSKSQNLMIMDACHSGSLNKIFLTLDFIKKLPTGYTFANEKMAVTQTVNLANCDYSAMQTVKESYDLVYFGATQDRELAKGNEAGSALTYWLSVVIRDAKFTGAWQTMTYRTLACQLSQRLNTEMQTMVYREIGEHVTVFSTKTPFKIN